MKPGKKIYLRLKQPTSMFVGDSGTPEHMTTKSDPIGLALPNGMKRNMGHTQSAVFPTTGVYQGVIK